MSAGFPLKSAIALWIVAPALLGLSLYRPYGGSTGRAAGLPAQLAGYESFGEQLTDQHRALLGTDDAVWRRYVDAAGHAVWVTCVFHGANWKSIHPPHICLEGSDMTILEDGAATVEIDGQPVTVGRLLAQARSGGERWVSLFVFAAPGFRSHDYRTFVLHHLPRALLRQTSTGFLLRVEGPVGPDGDAAAEGRCRELLRALLPAAERLLEQR